ncbi:MAG: hypothetical protein DBY05_07190 [Clostridiales bacterium]|nr:MAG: hypothetical protein DBY05_07190 [Clostridiales bacterium]
MISALQPTKISPTAAARPRRTIFYFRKKREGPVGGGFPLNFALRKSSFLLQRFASPFEKVPFYSNVSLRSRKDFFFIPTFRFAFGKIPFLSQNFASPSENSPIFPLGFNKTKMNKYAGGGFYSAKKSFLIIFL